MDPGLAARGLLDNAIRIGLQRAPRVEPTMDHRECCVQQSPGRP